SGGGSVGHRAARSLLIFSVVLLPRPPGPALFPYTTLVRSTMCSSSIHGPVTSGGASPDAISSSLEPGAWMLNPRSRLERRGDRIDRKSTRLNSSHVKTSYAVFCLQQYKTSQYSHYHPDVQ